MVSTVNVFPNVCVKILVLEKYDMRHSKLQSVTNRGEREWNIGFPIFHSWLSLLAHRF